MVVAASPIEVGMAQSIELKLLQKARVAVEARLLEETGRAGDSNDFLGEGIAPLRIGIDDPVIQGRPAPRLDPGMQVLRLLLEEPLPVGDEVLHFAELRAVDRRVINLGDHPMLDREPGPAVERAGGSDPLLIPVRPERLVARSPEGLPLAAKLRHGPAPLPPG